MDLYMVSGFSAHLVFGIDMPELQLLIEDKERFI